VDDPVTMRRRLRTELKRLRLLEGLTQRQAAEQLDWSLSKIIRIENGTNGLSTTDLRALLTLYGITRSNDINQLVLLARYSRRLPFSDLRDVLPVEAVRFFGYEASASVIRQVQPLIVPGLLQTTEYARSILDILEADEHRVARLLESRRERQKLLAQKVGPPLLSCILDEAVLRRAVGGRTVMVRQLEHLLEMAARPNVEIRMLPFDLGGHRAVRGPFIVLEFANASDLPLLYLEDQRGSSTFEDDPDVVTAFLEMFLELERRASAPDRLPYYVERALRELSE
jgi:transcriptional regulator with XRE-family HTH domain